MNYCTVWIGIAPSNQKLGILKQFIKLKEWVGVWLEQFLGNWVVFTLMKSCEIKDNRCILWMDVAPSNQKLGLLKTFIKLKEWASVWLEPYLGNWVVSTIMKSCEIKDNHCILWMDEAPSNQKLGILKQFIKLNIVNHKIIKLVLDGTSTRKKS